MNWIALVACAWLSPAAQADSPGPDPRALGITEATMSFCAKFDPATVPWYREKIKRLEQGASQEQLAGIRQSDAYQRARASLEDFVSKVDEHNAKHLCANGLKAR